MVEILKLYFEHPRTNFFEEPPPPHFENRYVVNEKISGLSHNPCCNSTTPYWITAPRILFYMVPCKEAHLCACNTLGKKHPPCVKIETYLLKALNELFIKVVLFTNGCGSGTIVLWRWQKVMRTSKFCYSNCVLQNNAQVNMYYAVWRKLADSILVIKALCIMGSWSRIT